MLSSAKTLLLRVVLRMEGVPRSVKLFGRLVGTKPGFFTAFTMDSTYVAKYHAIHQLHTRPAVNTVITCCLLG